MWDKINISRWKETPSITGKAATEEDVQKGFAVFYIPSGSTPYDIELPLCAIQTDEETGKRIPCIAIQIEEAGNGVTVGVRYIDGGNGVGMAHEFELYSEATPEFLQLSTMILNNLER